MNWKKVDKLIPFEEVEHYCDYDCYDSKKGSIALIASNGDKSIILDYTGGSLDYWLNECGVDDEFDGIAPGVWIWEGGIKTHRDYWGEYDSEMVGDLRELTDEEWGLFRKGKDLWDQDFYYKCVLNK